MPAWKNSHCQTRTWRRSRWNSPTYDLQWQTNLETTLRVGDALQQETPLHSPTRISHFHRSNCQQEKYDSWACLLLEVQDYCEKLRSVHSAKRRRQSEMRHGWHLGLKVHVLLQEQRNFDAPWTSSLQRQPSVARHRAGLHNSAQ